MSVFNLMLAPFVECLILVGIHSYLGLHVIRRRIIFVDLALAQIAALGATVGMIFGITPGSPGCFLYALTFCLLGAALFSFTRVKDDRVPQEAVIGLVYAITAALAILVVQKTTSAEHLEGILVGNLLWVRWSDIAAAGVAYAIIGVIHLLFYRKFRLISENPEEAYRKGMSVRLWDFLFYATFGFVITFSVRVAGVLLVFVFLVAPAILAVMVTQSFRAQLLVGWIAGTIVTVSGLYASYMLDLPSGPTVVAAYGLALAAASVGLAIVRSDRRVRTLAYAAAGTAVVLAVGYGLALEGQLLARLGGEPHHAHVLHGAPASPTPGATEHQHDGKDEAATHATAPDTEDAAADPDEQLTAIRTTLKTDRAAAMNQLIQLMASDEVPPFYLSEACALLREIAGQDFGYKPEGSTAENSDALAAIRAWFKGEDSV